MLKGTKTSVSESTKTSMPKGSKTRSRAKVQKCTERNLHSTKRGMHSCPKTNVQKSAQERMQKGAKGELQASPETILQECSQEGLLKSSKENLLWISFWMKKNNFLCEKYSSQTYSCHNFILALFISKSLLQ